MSSHCSRSGVYLCDGTRIDRTSSVSTYAWREFLCNQFIVSKLTCASDAASAGNDGTAAPSSKSITSSSATAAAASTSSVVKACIDAPISAMLSSLSNKHEALWSATCQPWSWRYFMTISLLRTAECIDNKQSTEHRRGKLPQLTPANLGHSIQTRFVVIQQ